MRYRTNLILTGAGVSLLVSLSAAQERVFHLGAEASSNSDYGRTVAEVGDVDGDGRPEILVGAPFDSTGGTFAGAIYLYSGETGELLWSRLGPHAGDLYGSSIAGLGDVDGDGRGDMIIGAPGWDNGGIWGSASGAAFVLSGATSNTMVQIAVNQQNARLGYKVCSFGDIDGDGIQDYAVATPYRDLNGLTDNGYVGVYSGADNSFLFSRTGSESGARLGFSMSGLRPTGSQATSRVLMSEPAADGFGVDRGRVTLMDGYGNTVTEFYGFTDNEWFGTVVAGVGDTNNDGWQDYAIGSPYADILFVGVDAGMVRVYSGASHGVELFRITGASAGANMGLDAAGAGDVDGDGRMDVLAGAPDDSSVFSEGGEVRLVSGNGGAPMNSWFGGISDHMGYGLATLGDLNADGAADFVIGAKDAPFGAGEAYVHLGSTTAPTIYCAAKLNSQGCSPVISTTGTPSLSIADDFHISSVNMINQKFGLLFWGTGSNNTPFQGGLLCVQPPQKRTTPQSSAGSLGAPDCSGTYDFHFSQLYMETEGVLAGDRIYAQFWSRDPAASFQTGLTNAVAFDVIP